MSGFLLTKRNTQLQIISMAYQTKIAVFGVIFFWASAFVGIRIGLQDYSPEGLALLRYLVASACMAVLYYRLPKRDISRFADRFALFLLGAIGIGFYNLMLNYGESSVSSGMASFIISQSPIITAIFALFFLGEKLTALRAFGFIVSVFGVACIVWGETKGFYWNKDFIYILIAALAGSAYSIFQKPFVQKFHAIEVTAYVIWGGTVFLAFYFPELKQDVETASLKTTLTIFYLGVFPAAVGYIGWSYILSNIPVARAASFLYFMPFLATFLGWVCLQEVPAWVSAIGALFAIFGVYLVNHSYQSKKMAVAAE